MNAPQTAAVAAEQLHELGNKLDARRRTSLRMRAARDDAEYLYRSQKHAAFVRGVPGKNAEERDAHAMTVTLEPDVRLAATDVADRLELKGWTPSDIDDLRWLRDRADGIAEATSAAAYDSRDMVRAWVMVASMAKAERDDVLRGHAEASAA